MPLCEPWVDAESVELCSDVTDAALRARAVIVSSNLLYALSGRQFSGRCTDVVRPCRWPDGGWVGDPFTTWGHYSTLTDRAPLGCMCAGPVACGQNHDALPLPNTPVVAVTEVLVDGEALDEDWVIVDDLWVVRLSPERWPTTQYLDRAATEEGTWQVTYEYGTAVPPDAVLAAEVLACELARGWSGGECRLPRGVTNVVAENVSYDFGPEALQGVVQAGLPEVESFLRARNPNRLMRRGRLLNPRAHQPRRHRRIRAGAGASGASIYSGGSPSNTGGDIYDGGTPGDTGDDIYSGGTP